MLLFFGCMYPGGQRGGRFGHQFGAGPGGAGSLKVPPSWCAERSQDYTFRAWLADVVLWAGATDLDAERHGPAVAMQVTGAAREVIREIPAEVLRQGRALPNGQMETGLMILMRTLAERYSLLEVESSSRSIAELINLRRLGSESIGSCLTRFDILRTRAVNRANFQMGVPGLAWMLALIPISLRITTSWRSLLRDYADRGICTSRTESPSLDETLPPGKVERGAMPCISFQRSRASRARGRTATMESPGKVAMLTNIILQGRPWARLPSAEAVLPVAITLAATKVPRPPRTMAWMPTLARAAWRPAWIMNELGNVLHNDYHIAKKRWRRFQNKMPRQRRRFGGKVSRPPAFASFLPSRAFAGGKGKGGGKNSKKNPVDSNGRTLRCHNCGSEEHLVKHCPTRSTSHHATASGSGGPHGSGQGVITTSSWHARPSEVEDLVQMLSKRSRSDEPQAEPPTEIVRLLPGFIASKYSPAFFVADMDEFGYPFGFFPRLRRCGRLCAMAQAASYGHSSRKRTLARQMSVEGVGKQAQVAKHEEEVAIGFKDMSGQVHVGKFTAPVIDDSALPPFWGRSSLAEQKAILDVGNNCLILPGPGGVEMRLSPGSMTLPLTLSESGHLLLEVHHFGNSKLKSSQEEVHSFAGKGAEEMTSIHDGRPLKANRKEGRVAFN